MEQMISAPLNKIHNQQGGWSRPCGLIEIINEIFGVDDLAPKRYDERH